MKRIIKLLFIIAIAVFGYSYFSGGLFSNPLSPKKTVVFEVEGLELEVFYNRPSKRNREVFGALVPYNEVWRTGANEATTFETNKDLKIGEQTLKKGKYSIWTIPKDTSWTVIFNSKMYPWGVDETMQPMREGDFDVLSYETTVNKINTTVEQFTIAFDNSTDNLFLTMAWDNTKIEVPLKY
jgi:hypothetical protein